MTREGRADIVRGTLGECIWAEDWSTDLVAAEVIASLRRRFIGLRAVCASWDSGMLDPVASGFRGWEMQSGQAVSPVIDVTLAQAWPRSSCGWDEWYFFDHVPAFDKIDALSRWCGVSVAEAVELEDVPTGFSLAGQLLRYRPQVVIGDGERVFMVAESEQIISEFVDLCEHRRTTRCS